MSAETLRKAAERLRDQANAATPGPWERGDNWWVQGSTFCRCDPDWAPAIERRMNINGKVIDAHIHRVEDKWPHGIYTAELQADGHAHNVVNDTDEYGYMNDADSAYIATMHPGVGLAIADWLEAVADNAAVLGFGGEGQPGSPHARAHAVARLILGGAS